MKYMKWKKLREAQKAKKIKSWTNIYKLGARSFREKSSIKTKTQNIYIEELFRKIKNESYKTTSK